jgi:hypothetical protein
MHHTELEILGLTILDAAAKYPDLLFREVERDGKEIVVTAEFYPNRVNISTKKGIIIEVNSVG